MLTPKLLLLFGLGLGLLVLAAALPTFVINGKTVKVDTLEKGGKYYVEVQGFAKALGVSLTYDKAKNQFVIASIRRMRSNPDRPTHLVVWQTSSGLLRRPLASLQ